MKHLFLVFFCFASGISLFSQTTSNIQQLLSVNGTGNAADPSAQLDVSATDKGMLVPRMTTLQRTAITAANALLVFDSETRSFWFFDTPAAAWREIRAGNITTLADADGDTKVQVEESPNENIIRFDLGGTENMVLRKNAGGSPRLEFPGSNTFVGTNAGNANTGSHSTATGSEALAANTTGSSNSAFGANALTANTSGADNVAVGKDALFYNTSGSNNTAVGVLALFKNTTANHNSAFGRFALANTTTGSFNVACGSLALVANTTGYSNVAVGRDALNKNTVRSNLVAVGDSALYNNGTGASSSIEAAVNTAIGSKAMYGNTTGYNNTASGASALYANSTGYFNMANGANALYANNTGAFNTASGADALYANTSGAFNTAHGTGALYFNNTGSSNTALGLGALNFNTIGDNNTAIGAEANVTADNLSNATAIGYNAKVGASNSLVLGGTGADAVNVGIGTQTPGHPLHLNAVGTGFAHTAGSVVLTTFADPTYSPAGGWIGTVSNHPLFFFADNPAAPQMTLTQNGDLGIGISTVPAGIRLQVEGNIATPSGNSVYVGGVTNDGVDGLRLHQTAGGSYIDHKGAGDLLFRADNTLGGTPRMTIRNNGNVGIGRNPVTNLLEVEGDASKSSAGDWLANSDARLKKNIQPLNSQLMLQSLLALRGVTYEWNDDQTGSKRPEGIQYGFTAQNIQEVFPTLVEEDKLGFLQTAYGTYDAMTVEAIRALHLEIENGEWRIENLVRENAALKVQLEAEKSLNATQSAQLDKIAAALAGAGIAVEK